MTGSRGLFVVGLAAVFVAAGCSSVVNGQGAALAPPTTARTSGGFPATTSVPPTGTATRGSASTGPGGNGVRVTYAAGHLSAVFPSQPAESSQSGDVAGGHFTVYLAVSRQGGPVEAACEVISEPVPPAGYQITLTTTVDSFEGSSGLTLKEQHATTFRGHVARAASFTSPAGDPFSFLAFFQTDERFYLLFGPTGATFDTLTSTFEALP